MASDRSGKGFAVDKPSVKGTSTDKQQKGPDKTSAKGMSGEKSKDHEDASAEDPYESKPKTHSLVGPAPGAANVRVKPSTGSSKKHIAQTERGEKKGMDSECSSKKVRRGSKAGRSINDVDLAQPPKTLFKTYTYSVEHDGRELGVHFSQNHVVRSVKRSSPFYFNLLVGDQIIDVNGHVPTTYEQLRAFIIESPNKKCVLTIMRPWNMRPLTELRQPSELDRRKMCNYYIIEMYRFRQIKNGFEIKYRGTSHKYCYVSSVEKGSRSAYSLKSGDKILDIDAVPISLMYDLNAVKKKFNDVMMRDGMVSLLVERPHQLCSTSNPSAYAKPLVPPSIEMGEDAVEIGCRQAFKHVVVKNRLENVKSVMKGEIEVTATGNTSAIEANDEDPFLSGKRKRKKKKKITLGQRTDYRIPSEVKPDVQLQKVTARSGIISFVRSVAESLTNNHR